jgi:hypothetical protein
LINSAKNLELNLKISNNLSKNKRKLLQLKPLEIFSIIKPLMIKKKKF